MHRLLVLVSVVAVSACVADEGDEGFVIRNNLAPGDNCTFTPDVDAPYLPRGAIALQAPSAYQFNPLIESRITALEGQESQRTVQLLGAKVDLAIGPILVESNTTSRTVEFSAIEISALQMSGALRFRSLFAASLSPNGGLLSTGFDLVPTTALAAIRTKVGTLAVGERVNAQVIATATVYGSLGGDELEGRPYVYPVSVCSDCVINVLDACDEIAEGTEIRTGNSCSPFQDGVVDCCTKIINNVPTLVCPAPVASALQAP